jgi:hypothetical protein
VKGDNITMSKANCTLLAVRRKYYYAEEFGKFIEIEEWEHDRILKNPDLYYFSTALKKHLAWSRADQEGTTLTFSEAIGDCAANMQFPLPPHRVRNRISPDGRQK